MLSARLFNARRGGAHWAVFNVNSRWTPSDNNVEIVLKVAIAMLREKTMMRSDANTFNDDDDDLFLGTGTGTQTQTHKIQ